MMATEGKKTVYYVIVNEKNRMLLQDCKLPIYWSKKAAENRVKLFTGFKVIAINAPKFNQLLKA